LAICLFSLVSTISPLLQDLRYILSEPAGKPNIIMIFVCLEAKTEDGSYQCLAGYQA